jgi:hypothetical protein
MESNIFTLENEMLLDINERKKTMLSLKTLTLRYRFREDDQRLLIHHSIPIIYSIWEGFVQTSFQTYIRELNKLELTLDIVCDSLLIFYFETQFKQFAEYPKKPENKVKFFVTA